MNGLGESTPAWIRTKDQLIKSQLLYQLSYRGILYKATKKSPRDVVVATPDV
jgi:hypothetical protein